MKIKWRNIIILLGIVGAAGLAAAALLLPKETLDKLIAQLPIPKDKAVTIKELIPGLGQTPSVTIVATPMLTSSAPVTITVAAGRPVVHEDLSWFSTPMPTPAPVTGAAAVQVQSLNLRAGPGTEYQVVGAAKQGDKLPILGRNLQSTWFRVQVAGVGEAWVFAQLVTVDVQVDKIPIAAMPPTPTPTR